MGKVRRMDAATLELRNVRKTYPGAAAPAIADLNLQVGAGEICVLVGPSGCGKTTAMRLINRMIELTSGEILLDGKSIADRKTSELRREIGYAIQQIGLFPHQTIAQNISTVPKLLGWDKSRMEARVGELMELIGLDQSLAKRYPAQLSGGQRQRVGVARALAADPPLLLMDEPFGAIDPINRERLQNEFLRLQGELRKTIVFVTHDIDEAIKMGDKIAILKEGGELAQYAPPAELLTYPADRFVEDFVGSDRGLKRLALQRVRDIDLWTAATVRVGELSSGVQAKLDEADIKYPLLVDEDGCPVGWLSQRAFAGERVTEDIRSKPDPIVELDDILRDALSDLMTHESRYGPVVDAKGRVAGVLSIEALSHALAAAPEDLPGPAERAISEDGGVSALLVLAQSSITPRDRSVDDLPAEQRPLPRLDLRQLRPLRHPVQAARRADVAGAAVRLRDRLRPGAARLPPAAGWSGPITAATGVLYTLPSLAVFFLLQPVTGRGLTTATIALTAYTLLILFRNVMLGLDNVPGRGQGRGRRPGHDPGPAALQGRAAARRPGDLRRAADRGDHHRRPGHPGVPRRRGRARRAAVRRRRRHQLPRQRRRSSGCCASCSRRSSTWSFLVVQRLVSPWQRAGRA